MFPDIGRTIGDIFGMNKKKREERPRPFTGVATTPPVRQQPLRVAQPQRNPFQQQAQNAFQQPRQPSQLGQPIQPSTLGQPIQVQQPVEPVQPVRPVASQPGQFVRQPQQIQRPLGIKPSALNAVANSPAQFAKGVGETLQTFARAPEQLLRSVGQFGAEALDPRADTSQVGKPTILGIPGSEGVASVLYGNKPVENYQKQSRDLTNTLRANQDFKKTGLAPEVGLFAAPALALGDATAFSGLGIGTKQIPGATSRIGQVLDKTRLNTPITNPITNKVTNDPLIAQAVANLKPQVSLKTLDKVPQNRPAAALQTQIEQAHNAGDSARVAQLAKNIDQGMNPDSHISPEHRAQLIEQARKHKSADEFVNSHSPVYHGTNADLTDISQLQSGRQRGEYSKGTRSIFASENPNLASAYGKNVLEGRNTGKVLDTTKLGDPHDPNELVVPKEFSDYTTSPILDSIDRRVLENSYFKGGTPSNIVIDHKPNIQKYFRNKGYSAIQIPRGSDVAGPATEMSIIDHGKIQSRQQLTELYKQAQSSQLSAQTKPSMNPNGGLSAAAKAKYVAELSKPRVSLKTPDVKVPLEVTNAGTLRGGFAKAVIDRESPIVDYLKNIEKQTGQKGLVNQFYYDTGLQRRSNAIANSKVQNSKELEGALRGLKGKSKEEFDAYAAARNELSNARRGLPTTAPVEDLQLLVNNLTPKHGQRFEQLNKFYKGLSKSEREAHITDEATYQQHISNPDYSRIQRDMSDLANPRGRGGNSYSLGTSITSQKRKGSSRAIQPADVTAFNYAQQVQKEIQRNQTASNLIDVLASQGHARQLTPKEAVNKNTLKRIVDGKTEVWEVPKDIKEIADNVKPYQLGPWQKIVSAPQRLLRAGATGLNPTFTASNYVKDQVSSAIFSKTPAATHTPANAVRGLGHASKDFAGGSNDPLYKKFVERSGDTTQIDFIRNVKNAKQLSREIRGGAKGQVASRVMNPIRTLEDLNQVTEKATRFQNFKGTYDKVLKQSGNEEEALKQATLASWQNSVDFSRMGEVTQAINLLIPYFNASIQGTRLLARNLKERPVPTISKIGGLLATPVVGATVYNTSDPERKKIYDNISDYEKENNVIVITPGAKQLEDGSYEGVIKIPLQPGVSNLVQPLRLAAEAYANGKPTDVGRAAQLAAGAFTGPLNTSSAEGLLGGLIPQGVKPTVQQVANKDLYSGKEIVPDYINEATDSKGNPVKESDKAFSYTSGSSRLIGKALNVSPIRVDKFIKDTSGKVGQYSQNVVDEGLAAAGVIPKDQIGGVNFPKDFARRFSQASSKYNHQKSEGGKYFDEVKKVTQALNVNEKGAFQALHPQTKNFKGDQIYEREAVYDPAARLDVYNRYPKVFEADKKLDAESQKRGNPGNPMFKLENWQLKKVLEKENLPPGAKDPELSNLRDQDWYADFSTQKSDYFTQLSEKAKKEGKTFGTKDNPYPNTPPDLQKIMDNYSALPSGTGARKSWISSNPGQYKRMQDQYASIDNWQNIQRGKRGLDATEGATGEASGYGASSSGYASRGRGGGGGGGGGSNEPDLGKSAASYAVSLKSGGQIAKPKVTVKKVTPITTKSKVSITKPKVSLKKGAMKGKSAKA